MFSKIKINKHAFSLFFLVISTFLLSQSYSAAISFAQSEPGLASGVTQSPAQSILVCEFVQYCSNPVELSTNVNDTAATTIVTPETEAQTQAETEAQTQAETEAQTQAETEAQTQADSSELLPDVTSNISLIMTPDLPGNLTKDSQDPVNQGLLATNETQPVSSNATDDSQLVVPENATVITPDAQIPFETASENISMTIQDNNGTTTPDSSSFNQSELANTVPLNNVTMSIDGSNMSQSAPVDETMNTTGANETMNTTGANETMNTTGANETMNTTGANETMNTTGANETMNTTGANETAGIGTPIGNGNQSTVSNETISTANTNVNQQDNTSNGNQVQPNSGPTSENQTVPPSLLDPLINPFKELFGIK
jgi:hypothetical protein